MRSVVITILALGLAPAVLAEDIETVQKYRHGVYEAIGGHMTAIANIVRNGFRPQDLQYHANAIQGLSRIVPELFPAGSGGGDTEALPVIWEKPDEFGQRMQDFAEAADGIAAAAGSGDMRQVGGALQSLGRACKGCHDNFRKD